MPRKIFIFIFMYIIYRLYITYINKICIGGGIQFLIKTVYSGADMQLSTSVLNVYHPKWHNRLTSLRVFRVSKTSTQAWHGIYRRPLISQHFSNGMIHLGGATQPSH